MSLIFENKSLYESIGINGHHIDDCVYKHGSSRDSLLSLWLYIVINNKWKLWHNILKSYVMSPTAQFIHADVVKRNDKICDLDQRLNI